MIIDILQFLIFPGALFIILMGIFSVWMLRKMSAKMVNRVGPPFFQPLYDFLKLNAKENTYPEGVERIIIDIMPLFQIGVALMMAFFIPIIDSRGLISFEGDVFFFLFLLALHGSTTYLIGIVCKNPYTISGAGRAVTTEISLEIPLSISIAGLALITGQISISGIATNLLNSVTSSYVSLLLIIPICIFLFIAIYSSLGALELNPFSAAHADTEIAAGWKTEISGPNLARTKLADWINLFNLAGLISMIFLPNVSIIITGEFANLLTSSLYIVIFFIKLLLILYE